MWNSFFPASLSLLHDSAVVDKKLDFVFIRFFSIEHTMRGISPHPNHIYRDQYTHNADVATTKATKAQRAEK